MCKLHYNRWKRHGDPLAGRTKNGSIPLFIEAAKSYAGDDCLIWPFATVKGYACARIDQKTEYVCQIICEHAHGAPPEGKPWALHSCDNGHLGCIAPKHLHWGDAKDNGAEMAKRGRSCKGMSNHDRKYLGARKVEDGIASTATA